MVSVARENRVGQTFVEERKGLLELCKQKHVRSDSLEDGKIFASAHQKFALFIAAMARPSQCYALPLDSQRVTPSDYTKTQAGVREYFYAQKGMKTYKLIGHC